MFTSVVAELQGFGADLADALRIANAIDFTRSSGTAKEIAVESWQEDQEGLDLIRECDEWEEQQESLLEALSYLVPAAIIDEISSIMAGDGENAGLEDYLTGDWKDET